MYPKFLLFKGREKNPVIFAAIALFIFGEGLLVAIAISQGVL